MTSSFLLLLKHLRDEDPCIFGPELHIVLSLGLHIAMRHLVLIQKSVELTVLFKQEVLGSTRHINIRHLPLFIQDLFYQHLRIIAADLNPVQISEAAVIVLIIGNLV